MLYVQISKEFPSPCGDYGSYPGCAKLPTLLIPTNFRPLAGIMVLILYDLGKDEVFTKVQFPSPCGDYGSYRLKGTARKIRHNYKISVPLRGLWFLSWDISSTYPGSTGSISVPLRGLWFLSKEVIMLYIVYCGNFRPLAGIMVLISCQRT